MPVVVRDPEVMNGMPCFADSRAFQESGRLSRGRSLFGRIPEAISERHARNGDSGSRRGKGVFTRPDRMRILLDECLPIDFRHSFSSPEAHTVEWAGFKAKKNGELLQCVENAGYETPVTVDQGLPVAALS
jgi:hypothetical protein